MGFYLTLLSEVQDYLEKNPNMPEDLVVANLVSKRMKGFRKPFDYQVMKDAFRDGGKHVSRSQYDYDNLEIAENVKRVEKYYKKAIKTMVDFSKVPRIGFNPTIEDSNLEIHNETLDVSVMQLLKPETSADAKRYNNRLINTWKNGTIDDRKGIINEYLDEVSRIDLSKWHSKDTDYIMEHYDEYLREVNIIRNAGSLYLYASFEGFIEWDTAKIKQYRELSDQADADFLRVEYNISYKTLPFGAFVKISNLENPTGPQQEEQDKVRSALFENANAYRSTELLREKYDKFVKECELKQIKVPTSSNEFVEKFDDFKSFPDELCASFYEAIKHKETASLNGFPWEAADYDTLKMAYNSVSEEELAKYNSIKAFNAYYSEYKNLSNEVDMRFEHDYYLGEFEVDYAPDRKQIDDLNYTGRYQDIITGLKFYLGYDRDDEMPLVLGGGDKAELIKNANDFNKLSEANANEIVYAFDKNTGRTMAIKLDFTQWNSLQKSNIAIKEAHKDDIAELKEKQVAAVTRKIKELGEYRDLLFEVGGEDTNELRDAIHAVMAYDPDEYPLANLNEERINNNLSAMFTGADSLRKHILNKSSNGLLSDNEGKALLLCENLKEIASNNVIGVPKGSEPIIERMEEESSPRVPDLVDVTLSTTRLCDSFDATCTGFRNDSAEFKYLHESVKVLREQLGYAAKNKIEIDNDSLREEYNRVFTAAKKYMEHRTGMATKNGRTQTRLSFAKDIVAMGEALGCKVLTDKELLAHTLNDKLTVAYMGRLKKNPNSPTEVDYLKKCLANRRDYNSRTFNDAHFSKVAAGMKKDALLKSIYSEAGRDDFVMKVTDTRKKYEEAERIKASHDPYRVRLIKDTDIYKKTERDLQLAITRAGNSVCPASKRASGYVGDYFTLKFMHKELLEMGKGQTPGDAALEERLKKFTAEYTRAIRNGYNNSEAERKVKQELSKTTDEHARVTPKEFERFYSTLEKEMLRKKDDLLETHRQEKLEFENSRNKATKPAKEEEVIDTSAKKVEEAPKPRL